MTGPGGALAGRRVVVAGASMGIGRAVAVRCADEGASVVVGARGRDSLDDAVAAVAAVAVDGAEVLGVAGSIADHDIAGRLVGTAVEVLGGVDVLINCAGIAEPVGSSILDIDPSDWQELIDVHLTGTFNTCQHAARVMVDQGRGAIVNTSSHAFLGMYGGTGYPAGKGGTNSLTFAIAAELAEHGVRANAVCPGGRTRLSTGPEFEAHVERLHARGLLDDTMREASLSPAPPEHVAALYAFLASEASAPVTGELFWGAGPFAGRFPAPSMTVEVVRDPEAPPASIAELASAFGTGPGPGSDEIVTPPG
ncbi:MAG: SDR family NAD(P)-dependent oxidoreductase [Actinobacteria bacterium]|nr:SDR family NAD(P)-dependent oxidoreductase [Actinomycetota bacterium]